MVKLVLCVVLSLCCAAPALGQQQLPPADKVAEYLQSISVTLKSGTAQGSGTLVVVKVDGQDMNFVWTAAHVIDGQRTVKEIVTPDGQTRKIVTFADPQIVQELIEDGRRVGETKVDTKVIVFSEKEDLALLRVRKRGFSPVGAVFYAEKDIPRVGTRICHCGSPGGQEIGAASFTQGVISQVGRTFSDYSNGAEMDQGDCAAMPGSSGGMITLADGRYIGMLTLGIRGGDSFHYFVPMRRIRAWAAKMKVSWALGDGAAPSREEIDKLPIEDTGTLLQQVKDAVGPKGLYYMDWPARWLRSQREPTPAPLPDPNWLNWN